MKSAEEVKQHLMQEVYLYEKYQMLENECDNFFGEVQEFIDEASQFCVDHGNVHGKFVCSETSIDRDHRTRNCYAFLRDDIEDVYFNMIVGDISVKSIKVNYPFDEELEKFIFNLTQNDETITVWHGIVNACYEVQEVYWWEDIENKFPQFGQILEEVVRKRIIDSNGLRVYCKENKINRCEIELLIDCSLEIPDEIDYNSEEDE